MRLVALDYTARAALQIDPLDLNTLVTVSQVGLILSQVRDEASPETRPVSLFTTATNSEPIAEQDRANPPCSRLARTFREIA